MRISPKAFIFLCVQSIYFLVSIYTTFLISLFFNKICYNTIFCSLFRQACVCIRIIFLQSIVYCSYFQIVFILFARIRNSLRYYKSPIYIWARSSIIYSCFIKAIIINIIFIYITVNIIAIFICLICIFTIWKWNAVQIISCYCMKVFFV